jgi:hypothetical protein
VLKKHYRMGNARGAGEGGKGVGKWRIRG